VDTYHFAHDLIHEVVAGALSSRRRKILHQRVAVALEAEPGESALELLAYHYLRSDAREQTIVYLERAGDQAETQYAAAAAEGYYRELVALLERLGRAIDAARAREKLSRVLHAMGRYTVELEVLAHATAAYRAAGDLEGEARSVLAAALTQVRAGAPREVLRLLRPLQRSRSSAASRFALRRCFRSGCRTSLSRQGRSTRRCKPVSALWQSPSQWGVLTF
jgi:predicted ATPase